MNMEYFLGIDCSTQSLTGVLINLSKNEIIIRHSINFDEELPHYNTQNGVFSSNGGKVVHSNPLMWVEALELLFKALVQKNLPLNEIKAISGSGQQHGTVYLNNSFGTTLKNLDSKKSLVNQLQKVFTRETSPIWMDSSTTKQCEEIRLELGGLEPTISITGSNTFERFSGPQIRKFYEQNYDDYIQTSTIHLVSSFLSSILLGKSSPIDHGDGAGMNLMDIRTKQWDDKALNATALNLRQKLPPLVNSYDVIGKISPYFVERFGFSPETILIAWSGDNPNSLIGVGLTEKGKVAISLGTSDTYFSYMKNLNFDLKGEGHVFGAPTGDYMSLICYKNGSLARENVKDNFNLTWNAFSAILKNTPCGNYGKIMLPYFYPEIVPFVLQPKVYRFGFDEKDLEGNVRAIIEAQFLSMRLHSKWIGEKPEEIYATGGASANREILRVAADIFNTKVRIFDVPDSAALGAAFRSGKSYYDSINVKKEWSDLVKQFLYIEDSEVIRPTEACRQLYDDMLKIYGKYENFILKSAENPETYRLEFVEKYFN
jgi:xylulokinase